MEIDPTQFEAQVGTIFIPGALYDGAASKIYGFIKGLVKEKKELKVLAAYDLAGQRLVTAAEFIAIAKLPSREALLTQIAFVLTMPMKKVLIALNGRKIQLESK